MTRVRLTTLAAAAAALGLATGAGAQSVPTVSRVDLEVDVTGIHVDRWHFADDGYPDAGRTWVEGKGTQTLGLSTRRPVRFHAMLVGGRLLLVPTAAPKPLNGSLRRTQQWHHNDVEQCDREGGCDGEVPVVPLHVKPNCPAKRVDVPASVQVTPSAGGHLKVTFGAMKLDLWSNCPPDIEGIRRPLTLAQPLLLDFGAVAHRVGRLGRGETLTLKHSHQMGATDGLLASSCPALSGTGMHECAVTDITVEVTRVR